jgi:hypothetical protein
MVCHTFWVEMTIGKVSRGKMLKKSSRLPRSRRNCVASLPGNCTLESLRAANSRNANAGKRDMSFKSAESLFVAAGLALAPALAAAQQPERLLLLLRSDPHSPLSIAAERLSIRDVERMAVFEGNVQVTGANLAMQCSKLLIRYDAARDHALMYLDCQR